MTRRELLTCAAGFGGFNFAYQLLESLDVLHKPAPIDLGGLTGPAKGKVLILGAGIAGMCAAYELEHLGYSCVLLETRHRTGGRCVSVRGGDTLEEAGPTQKCHFQEGAFFNAGPTRIPYWHSTIDYCQKFGVKLAPWININEGAYVYQTRSKTLKDQKLRIRDIVADTEGRMAEVMAQSVKDDKLDVPLSAEDKQRIIEYVAEYGGLDRNLKYTGRRRRTYSKFHGAGPEDNVTQEPYSIKDLFTINDGWYFEFIREMDQQMTMLEVVGGVDHVARAFEAHIASPIHFGCAVSHIRTGPHGATVSYEDARGRNHSVHADFCICTIPATVLAKIPNNFDAGFNAVLNRIRYGAASKVAMEFKRRFWEEDERLFGGITWTDMPISQILYPSHDFFSKTGVLINYNFGFDALGFGAMAPHKRIQAALSQVARIHPQAPDEIRSAVTLAWHNVPQNKGAYVNWMQTSGAKEAYLALNRPQGRVYFAGEHVSHQDAWMAGAIESAKYVVQEIHVSA